MTLDDLKGAKGPWYLMTPYTKYPAGTEAAWRDACVLTAKLMRAGVNVFSPIAHSHPVAQAGRLDALSHEFWLMQDMAHIEVAPGGIVACMPSWGESKGITWEMERFADLGKPIYLLEPTTMEIA